MSSTADRDSGCFTCQVQINNEVNYLNYQNVRISGLVVESVDLGFKIDDGTGLIKVIYSNDEEYDLPKIGDYVEVLGYVVNQTPYFIKMKCVSIKSDPMFEVRHMLEMASIHKDFFKFQFLTDDTLLASQQSQSTEISKLSQTVFEFIKSKNGNPTTNDEIVELCGNQETATLVIDALLTDTLIYQDGQNYYQI
ncbi:OB-fold nucleic acid binding domain containing protein [Trichomonas vaginalis G3]|uniref:OB-fold nucleic acid binding domain containing protein n=1 Tax=Trichomonas vaginalis (strain ATCC PRA-98 / G3) TaxID=412133 RepID=A2F9W2_TRIV3|nr:CST complex subunit STN1 family [Trichomonas vaginalis G3]EAX98290.1 OB-fold nucleic acid binding domain containing protein [Trichomonas vaginalis G3]KAI5517480.1 CST complex subunit STN1 family [Trichomonas vaginalis G3]|eukprot:XP_001311220.1 OB-fold nucleic acid binding domain containing protein [Trichomonas vaginalis G3]